MSYDRPRWGECSWCGGTGSLRADPDEIDCDCGASHLRWVLWMERRKAGTIVQTRRRSRNPGWAHLKMDISWDGPDARTTEDPE